MASIKDDRYGGLVTNPTLLLPIRTEHDLVPSRTVGGILAKAEHKREFFACKRFNGLLHFLLAIFLWPSRSYLEVLRVSSLSTDAIVPSPSVWFSEWGMFIGVFAKWG